MVSPKGFLDEGIVSMQRLDAAAGALPEPRSAAVSETGG